MKRLLLDQGLPRSTASLLRDQGWDVVHAGDIGLARATDTQILFVATEQKRVVVTLDADFHALLAANTSDGPSVIRIRREGLNGPQVAALLTRCRPKIEQALAHGAVISITETTIRIRRLPIGS